MTDPAEPPTAGWLAWIDTRAAGPVHRIVHRHFWSRADVTHLTDLFTTRGRGVARRFIGTVFAEADIAGRPSVCRSTRDSDRAARALSDRVATLTAFVPYTRAPA